MGLPGGGVAGEDFHVFEALEGVGRLVNGLIKGWVGGCWGWRRGSERWKGVGEG